jgi:1,4-dihydroxy-2-naphthoyl-CoA synthase
VPTIAAVDGAVRAGGMTIAISCDMIIAGDTCTFGYPEIDVGLIPDSLRALPRLVGKHQAFGPFLGASMPRLPSHGPLSEVVPWNALRRAGDRGKFAAKSPIVMKIGRDAFMRAVDADFRCSVENAAESFALVDDGGLEGLNAFVENGPNYDADGGLHSRNSRSEGNFIMNFKDRQQMDNTMFSLLTMNPQPLHIDAHFSENIEFGHGCPTASIRRI